MLQERLFGAMRTRPLRTGLVALSVASALMVAIPASGSASSSGSKPVLTVGLPLAPSSLNPAKNDNALSTMVSSMTYVPLISLGSGFNTVPALATSWKYIGKGNKTFQFTIRSGAKFSDGTPLTAKAVKAWLVYFTKVANGPFKTSVPIKSIQTIGTTTLRLKLTAPDPTVAFELSQYDNAGFVANVQHPKALSSTSDGVGPYVLDPSETQTGTQYTFLPNKNYYDQSAIHFSKVVFKIITSQSSMLEALQSGELNAADLTTGAVPSSVTSKYKLDPVSQGMANFYLFDLDGKLSPALGNVKVRQALSYAINRKAITKALDPTGTPTDQMPTDYTSPALNNYFSYDPAKAKALLAAAGYPNGFTVNILDSGTAHGNEGDPVTQAVAQDWAAIGVKLQITSSSSSSQYIQEGNSGTYSLLGGTSVPTPLEVYYQLFWAPKGAINIFHDDFPALDKLMNTAAVASGAASAKAFAQAQAYVTKNVFNFPIFLYTDNWVVSNDITGFNKNQQEPWPVSWGWHS
jgi:peptide/nickel transport system substrate-binding protein